MSAGKGRPSHRRKRKQRAETPAPGPNGTSVSGDDDSIESLVEQLDVDGEQSEEGAAPSRASRSEARNAAAREELEPLAENERPLIVTIGALLSMAIALITVGAWVAGAEVDGERPNAFQVFAPAILFATMAIGMWRSRYWAVLGFQAVMAILMVGSFLTLVAATSVVGAVVPLGVIAVAGTLFWFAVKAMARIQMPDRHLPR